MPSIRGFPLHFFVGIFRPGRYGPVQCFGNGVGQTVRQNNRGREYFLTIPLAARVAAVSIPSRTVSPCAAPSSPRRKVGPVAHSPGSPPAPRPPRGRFTCATQSRGRSTGQALNQADSLGSSCLRRQRLPHCQSSARLTRFARSALRSTQRATIRQCLFLIIPFSGAIKMAA